MIYVPGYLNPIRHESDLIPYKTIKWGFNRPKNGYTFFHIRNWQIATKKNITDLWFHILPSYFIIFYHNLLYVWNLHIPNKNASCNTCESATIVEWLIKYWIEHLNLKKKKKLNNQLLVILEYRYPNANMVQIYCKIVFYWKSS